MKRARQDFFRPYHRPEPVCGWRAELLPELRALIRDRLPPDGQWALAAASRADWRERNRRIVFPALKKSAFGSYWSMGQEFPIVQADVWFGYVTRVLSTETVVVNPTYQLGNFSYGEKMGPFTERARSRACVWYVSPATDARLLDALEQAQRHVVFTKLVGRIRDVFCDMENRPVFGRGRYGRFLFHQFGAHLPCLRVLPSLEFVVETETNIQRTRDLDQALVWFTEAYEDSGDEECCD